MTANAMEEILLTEEQGQVLVALARKTLAEKFNRDNAPAESDPRLSHLADPQLQRKSGTFVTLKLHGQLRGCIGNLTGMDSLVEGIRRNAIQAAFHDSRFAPLTAEEFAHITLEISILTVPQKLAYQGRDNLIGLLRPGIDGVILKKGMAAATFLPQVWEQLPRPEDFLSYLCKKAGLAHDVWEREPLEIETYQVQHFS